MCILKFVKQPNVRLMEIYAARSLKIEQPTINFKDSCPLIRRPLFIFKVAGYPQIDCGFQSLVVLEHIFCNYATVTFLNKITNVV